MARPKYPNQVKSSDNRSDPVQPVAIIGVYGDPDDPEATGLTVDLSALVPATRAVAVVPNDGVDLTETPRALYIGGDGNISMIGLNAPVDAPGVTWNNVKAGTIIPFRPRRIRATGTTATGILAIY